ncbi:DNA polymerase III subunit alpha [Rhodococcus sp. 66b]|nr:DNA polymerase III subunit alpha [Rhodococcus sp. 66b]
MDDAATYELLARGDTLGVFQLDSAGMRELLLRMAPTEFNDLIASNALYRPGPMGVGAHWAYADRKNSRESVTPIHPELDEPLREILGETYALIVYQEQIMQIAQKVAGYSLGQADLLRRAMGKKKAEVLAAEFENFRNGMRANGYSDQAVTALWEAVLPFAGYAYNKSHAAGYSMVMYWTAYLKANYPAEYMAGLLTSVGDDKDKTAIYLSDCRARGVTVLPPDVNESVVNFASVGDDIRFGMGAVRNVGANVVASIIKARTEKSKFTDFSDYLGKIDAMACNKKVTESLIKAGAFDSLEHPRKGLMLVHADAIDSVMTTKKAEAIGQFDLFGGAEADESITSVFDVKIPDEEWDYKHRLALEREMLGLYVSGHPLDGIAAALTSLTDTSIAAVHAGKVRNGQKIVIGGIVAAVDRRVNKKGEPWAIVEIADLDAATEMLVFSATYTNFQHVLTEDSVLLVAANVNIREGRTSIVAVDISSPDLGNGGPSSAPMTLTLPVHVCTRPNIEALRDVLRSHPGDTDVHIALAGSSTTLWETDPGFRVHKSPALFGDLKALFGVNCLTAVATAGNA